MHARLALITALSLPALSALADPVLRVYDTRDLAAVLPSGSGGGTITIVPRLETDGSGSTLQRLTLGVQHSDEGLVTASPADLVVTRLCEQLQLQKESLGDGVYLVTGEADQHVQFVKLIEDVRSLYQGAYELELFTYPVAAAQAPALGAAPDSQSVTLRTRQVIARRVESRIDLTEELTYIRDWQPVVGNDSVGYDPDPDVVTRGLRLAVTAGAVNDAPEGRGSAGSGRIPLRLRGEWIDATVERQSSPLAPLSGGNLELGLPRITKRTIESDLRVPLGQAVVLAVVPGTKAGESVVIAGTVRELP